MMCYIYLKNSKVFYRKEKGDFIDSNNKTVEDINSLFNI